MTIKIRGMKGVLPALIFGAFLSVVFCGPLSGADFTFKVPITLDKIHQDLTQWRVKVEVSSEAEQGNPGTGQVAVGYKEFTVRNGVFRGVVVVTCDNEPGGVAKPEHANRYWVVLQVKNPKTGNFQHANLVMTANGNYPYDNSKPFKWHSQLMKLIQ